MYELQKMKGSIFLNAECIAWLRWSKPAGVEKDAHGHTDTHTNLNLNEQAVLHSKNGLYEGACY